MLYRGLKIYLYFSPEVFKTAYKHPPKLNDEIFFEYKNGTLLGSVIQRRTANVEDRREITEVSSF